MEKTKIFVIMPFIDDSFNTYEMLKKHFGDEFDFSHAGEEDNQQNILADIIPPIYSADIVLADLTGLNPNVMYELGIAHSFNKKTIIITRDDLSTLPFDLKQYRTKNYSTHFTSFQELVEYLEKNFAGAVTGSVTFGNPVDDFLHKNHLQIQDVLDGKDNLVDEDNEEKGFLDYLAEIEDDTNEMNDAIMAIASGMNDMSSGIDECRAEIDRVQQTGGNGVVSYVRKQSKKMANYVGNFSSQLKKHTASIGTRWSKIEGNILGLLENKYATTDGNKESLKVYISSLYQLMLSIKRNMIDVEALKETFLGNLGIERTMNQSIRSLDRDLTNYLDLTEKMVTSIERIVRKSQLIIGEIIFGNLPPKEDK